MIFLISFLLSLQASAEMIFIDLNDAGEEIAQCRAGIEAKNAGQLWQQPEELHTITIEKGEAKKGEAGYKDFNTRVREKILELQARGIPIDSIVISGHDGTGKFFGKNGALHQYEIQRLYKEFPELASTVTSTAAWGCYTTNVSSCDQYWLKRLPGMKVAMGFTALGPNKSSPSNHILLKQFCERRQEAAEASSLSELCVFRDSLEQLETTSMALCSQEGLASDAYGCATYDEVHRMCPTFINNKELFDVYDKYMTGDAEPPVDELPDYSKLYKKGSPICPDADCKDLMKACGGPTVSPPRCFYNKVQEMRHCVDQFKELRNYDMPYPPNILRLVKYQKIRSGLMKVNKRELKSYDDALERANLGSLKLGDISKLSRKEINTKIETAIAALNGESVTVEVPAEKTAITPAKKPSEGSGGGGSFMFGTKMDKPAKEEAVPAAKPRQQVVRAIKDPTLLRMAVCAHMTLVTMEDICTDSDLIDDSPVTKSQCLMSYERASKPKEDHEGC